MSATGPVRLPEGVHLFIDDHWIEASAGLVRTTHQPEKLPGPVIPKAESWHQQPLFFLTVLRDADPSSFRMWYNVKNPGHPRLYTCYAYAESQDGVNWHRPALDLIDVDDSKENNLFSDRFYFGLVLIDEGRDFPVRSQRYKLADYRAVNGSAGLCVAFSSDGLRFEDHDQNPVLPDNPRPPAQREAGEVYVSDIIDGCWDPLRNRYLVCFSTGGTTADGYEGGTAHAPEGYRRLVGQSTSRDFVHWDSPRRILVSDPKDHRKWEFYGMQPQVRGDLYLGFARILRDDLGADPGKPVQGIGWTELCMSRDGENWVHHREPFLDRNRAPGSWDHAMAWVGDCVTVGDEELVYYCGYSTGHKVGDRQIGVARLRKNGFVSRDAGDREGLLRTPLAIWEGAGMTVNAKVRGELRVRLLDRRGGPVPGFDWRECAPIRGDSVSHCILWNGKRTGPKGDAVRMEFSIREGELYGFELSNAVRA